MIDTPGLLDRPLAQHNEIEHLTYATLMHLPRALVLYVLDPTVPDLAPQLNIRSFIRQTFRGARVVDVMTKLDVCRADPGLRARLLGQVERYNSSIASGSSGESGRDGDGISMDQHKHLGPGSPSAHVPEPVPEPAAAGGGGHGGGSGDKDAGGSICGVHRLAYPSPDSVLHVSVVTTSSNSNNNSNSNTGSSAVDNTGVAQLITLIKQAVLSP